MTLKIPFFPPGYTVNVGYDAHGKYVNNGDIDIHRGSWETGHKYPESLVAWIPNPEGGAVLLKHRVKDGTGFIKTECDSQQEALDLIALRLCLGIYGEEI